MKKINWNRGWKFWKEEDAFALVWNVPEKARELDLPHDAMIEEQAHAGSPNKGNTGFRDGGNYVYVKTLFAAPEDREKTLTLCFDGVYGIAMVYVNEQLAAKNPFGYSRFYVPLGDLLRYGEDNEIRVLVKNAGMTNSRWYSGSGIYRDVELLEGGLCHLLPGKVRICTERIETEYAQVTVEAIIKNRLHYPLEIILETEIFPERAKEAQQKGEKADKEVSSERMPLVLFAGEERRISFSMPVENPRLWSAQDPFLYTCRLRLWEGEVCLDEHAETIGLRTISADTKKGLRINGRTVKLRGACIHHDSGLLGAATYKEAQFRQIARLKKAGFNGIRMAHHPMAEAMLCACDRLGMYVMDEAFDMWTRPKSDMDYALYFSEWWERDITAMVDKDYNHPCVILYSSGNEIPEIGTPKGAAIGAGICQKLKSLDRTRPALAAINGVFAAGDRIGEIVSDVSEALRKEGKISGNVNHFMALMEEHMDDIVVHPAITKRLESACAGWDIAGYNYMTARYEEDGRKYPNRLIVGSETYPPEIARNWALVEKLPHVIGDFTWTGWDYIGEAGVGIAGYAPGEGGFGAQYPCQLAYCGDFDLTGFRRPASYFREIVFGLRTDPYICIQRPEHYGKKLMRTPWMLSDAIAAWDFPGFENEKLVVEVYSPGEEGELFINGRSLGRKKVGKEAGYRVFFDACYEPGQVLFVTYEKGMEIGRHALDTPEYETSRLRAEAESGFGDELIYVAIQREDAKERPITSGDGQLRVCAEGDVEIAAFGSANPKTAYFYQTTKTETFEGRALLILKKTKGKEGRRAIRIADEKGEEYRFFLD